MRRFLLGRHYIQRIKCFVFFVRSTFYNEVLIIIQLYKARSTKYISNIEMEESDPIIQLLVPKKVWQET